MTEKDYNEALNWLEKSLHQCQANASIFDNKRDASALVQELTALIQNLEEQRRKQMNNPLDALHTQLENYRTYLIEPNSSADLTKEQIRERLEETTEMLVSVKIWKREGA